MTIAGREMDDGCGIRIATQDIASGCVRGGVRIAKNEFFDPKKGWRKDEKASVV
ncbi:uncharacterized protein FA14DRAFT_182683 [Meira miltonrushii]|uniref:Uncharacterized protein n=1 Tax=Meira miltonrushii TaxID=1280837 RepID=A0A316V5G2_9BASI|nr:uncharacterized protein FA14DRAFT_182683 [Meira miltonrushii]PWN31463.1 hypothetical protein FA14DRAFT_182683 [Meira miltonrushii]